MIWGCWPDLGIALIFSTLCLHPAKKFLSFPLFFFPVFYCEVVLRVTEASSSPQAIAKMSLNSSLVRVFSGGVIVSGLGVSAPKSDLRTNFSWIDWLQLYFPAQDSRHPLEQSVLPCPPLTRWKSDGFGVALGTTVGFLRLGGVCGCGCVEGRIGCPTSPSTFKHPAVNLSSWAYHQFLPYVLFSQLHLVSPAPSAFQSSWKHFFFF